MTETTVAEDAVLIRTTVGASGTTLKISVTEQTGIARVKVTAYVRYTETIIQ